MDCRDSFKSRDSRGLNSSEESNPSSGTQGSESSAQQACHLSGPPEPAPSHPSLWTPIDRPGPRGAADRLRRLRRLSKNIQLTPEQLRDILLFMYNNEDIKGYKCTGSTLYICS